MARDTSLVYLEQIANVIKVGDEFLPPAAHERIVQLVEHVLELVVDNVEAVIQLLGVGADLLQGLEVVADAVGEVPELGLAVLDVLGAVEVAGAVAEVIPDGPVSAL